MPTRYDATREDLAELLAGQPRFRVDQVLHGLYDDLASPAELTTLPKALREQLEAALPPALRIATEKSADDGETTKWVFSLADGAMVETVLMEYDDRVTACLSSQAGCAMGCTFCATGQAGFTRNLEVGEIVEQFVVAARAARPRRLSNIVFMGMGEPLANVDRLFDAIRRLHGDLGLSARRITVSTVGIIPGIKRLTDYELPVNLAVSLHAANDVTRTCLRRNLWSSPQFRMGLHRWRQRHRPRRARARSVRHCLEGAREPDPVEPNPWLPRPRVYPRQSSGVPR